MSVKGLTSWGGVTRLSYTVENGGIRPSGGSQRAMLHEAGQYAFINVSVTLCIGTGVEIGVFGPRTLVFR